MPNWKRPAEDDSGAIRGGNRTPTFCSESVREDGGVDERQRGDENKGDGGDDGRRALTLHVGDEPSRIDHDQVGACVFPVIRSAVRSASSAAV